MSIASEITRLQGVKSNILDAIAAKGVSVPSGAKLADCPALISSISGGGGEFVKGKTYIGGVEYPTVKIGETVWLAKNLNMILEGIPVNAGNSSNPVQYYKDGNYRETFGILYNGSAAEFINNNRNTICPGWRVPNKDDFLNLINYFNGTNHLDKVICASSYNYGVGDPIGFNLLPGGNWDKVFNRLSYENENAYLYSISKQNDYFYHLSVDKYGNVIFGTQYGDTEYGLNIRLVRND